MIRDLAIMILAAGASRRLGRPKQLLPWGDELLIEYQLRQVRDLQPDKGIWIVLGHEADAIARVIPKEIHTVRAANWSEGMGVSLAQGVAHIHQAVNPSYLLVILSDQPGFTSSHYLRLKEALEAPALAAATLYENRPGVPALFTRSCLKALSGLEGDRGASALLKAWGDRVISIVSEEDSFDIDTLRAYRESHNRIFGEDPPENSESEVLL